MKLAIIIPTYNERENIERLVEEILALNLNAFIVIVDDNSPDGTGKIADTLSNKHPEVRVIHRTKKQGLGAAYATAFKYVLDLNVEKVITMDADFSHDPKDIPRLFNETDYDVVVGSRYVQGGKIVGWSLQRKILSWGGIRVSRILLGLKTKDSTAGFKRYSRRFLESLPLSRLLTQGYAFQIEMILRAENSGFSMLEIPIIFKEREKGKSKVGGKEILEFAQNIIKLVLHEPPKETMRLLKFVIVGMIGAVLGIGLIWVLTDKVGIYYIISAIISAEIVIFSNFVFNEFWTFSDRRSLSILTRLWKSNLFRSVGLVINIGALFLLVEFFGIHYLLASVIAITLGVVWNYSTSTKLIWKLREDES